MNGASPENSPTPPQVGIREPPFALKVRRAPGSRVELLVAYEGLELDPSHPRTTESRPT